MQGKENLRKIEDISDFSAAADELIDSKYILAEKRISRLLKTIAENKGLMELFRTALNGYNYSVEFNRSKSAKKGKPILVLPKNQARKIAYVFCLLMEFDTGKRNFKDFLDQYYFMPQPNDSVALFTREMVVMFKEVTEYLYVNGITTLLDDENIDYSLRKQVGEVLMRMNQLVVESGLGVDTKRDLYVILAAIENALTPNKADCLRALVTGLDFMVNHTELASAFTTSMIELKSMLITADLY